MENTPLFVEARFVFYKLQALNSAQKGTCPGNRSLKKSVYSCFKNLYQRAISLRFFKKSDVPFNISEWEFRKRRPGFGVGHSFMGRKPAETFSLTESPSCSLTKSCNKLCPPLFGRYFNTSGSHEVVLLPIGPATWTSAHSEHKGPERWLREAPDVWFKSPL